MPVDFRLVAATGRDLTRRIDDGEFREDLFYRLRVVTVDLPSLRERPEDIIPLATHFLSQVLGVRLRRTRTVPSYLSAAAISELKGHPWKGNVRELENCIQRALVLVRGDEILPDHLGLGEDEGSVVHPGPGRVCPTRPASRRRCRPSSAGSSNARWPRPGET